MSKIRTIIERAKANQTSTRSTTAATSLARTSAHQPADNFSHDLNIASLRHVDLDEKRLQKNRILTHNTVDKHPVQGAYRMLRTRLMHSMRVNNWRVLFVSSISENEGKSFTSINLAISIAAKLGQEALLMDLDLRRPSVCENLGLAEYGHPGLKDYLENKDQPLEQIIVCPNIDRLGVVLSSDPILRSSDILASARGAELFDELRGRLHSKCVIIVDLPPLLAADDALAIAPLLDALLLVVAEGQTERTDIVEAKPILDSFNIIGCVLNKSVEKDVKRSSYY
jgi:capsular exopolysaccharide synthesis family protein